MHDKGLVNAPELASFRLHIVKQNVVICIVEEGHAEPKRFIKGFHGLVKIAASGHFLQLSGIQVISFQAKGIVPMGLPKAVQLAGDRGSRLDAMLLTHKNEAAVFQLFIHKLSECFIFQAIHGKAELGQVNFFLSPAHLYTEHKGQN